MVGRRQDDDENKDTIEIHKSLEMNLDDLGKLFKDCPDIIIRTLDLNEGKKACVIFIDGIVDKDLVQRDIIAPLLIFNYDDLLNLKESNPFPVAQIKMINCLKKSVDEILEGNTVILIDGLDNAMSCDVRRFEKRSIEEPDTERIIKGAHEGFVEPIKINLSILRRKIKSANLKIKLHKSGKRSNQHVAVIYIKDIANADLVKKVEERIDSIEYDYLSGAGYIEQLTSDNTMSPFPQYHMTERPDKAVANLMEGKILILLDGTPVALTVPVSFFELFQSMDDYNSHWMFGSFLRLLRFTAIFIAVFLPALYIAILTYHYQAVPLNLLIPLAESRAKVPFPPIIEALLMEITFELIREASIRLPSNLGPTVGIVGGLVIGQTAIEAGIVSNIMVVIVAITAIATFLVPTYDVGLLLRLSRFGTMLFAAFFGIVGVVIFGMLLFAHMVTLESLGQPYLQPLIPFKPKGLKDSIVRAPFTLMRRRPDSALPKDKTRGRGTDREK